LGHRDGVGFEEFASSEVKRNDADDHKIASLEIFGRYRKSTRWDRNGLMVYLS